MVVLIRLGRLNLLFDSFSMNNMIKFFRYNKYVDRGDIEGLHNQLKEQEESEFEVGRIMNLGN
jgi:hypothetical protein